MGRFLLVKSVIHSMLTYSFHVYQWPNALLKDIDLWIKNFSWEVVSSDLQLALMLRARVASNHHFIRAHITSLWQGIKHNINIVLHNSRLLVH